LRIVIYVELEDEILKASQATGKSPSKIVNEAIRCIDLDTLKFIERAELELKKGSEAKKRARQVDADAYGKVLSKKWRKNDVNGIAICCIVTLWKRKVID